MAGCGDVARRNPSVLWRVKHSGRFACRISKFLLPLLALCLSVHAVAQNGTIEGYVNDTDGKGVQGAVVSFDQKDFHFHTEDEDR